MTSNPVFFIDEQVNAVLSDLDKTLDLAESSQVNLTVMVKGKPKEKWYVTLLQIVIPFLIAGFGMVGAGIVLDIVQKWDLYKTVNEIIILVPALLGLKGNLEMTLASRLSTQVNLGSIHNKHTIRDAVLGNLAITQLQSVVVGFLASFVACITQFIHKQKFVTDNLLILVGSSVSTASIASLILGGIIMFLIIVSRNCKVNPDNIATPIASSMGDLVTLLILSYFGTFLLTFKVHVWIHITILSIFVVSIPLYVIYCCKNKFVKETLYQGWIPIIAAMLISSIAGILLEIAIKDYGGIAVYQPVVNGVGGNLVAILASRLSTSLHSTGSDPGKWANWAPSKYYLFPYDTFFRKSNPESKTALLLLSLAIPGHLIFFFTIFYIKSADSNMILTVWLVIFYIAFAFAQVLILLLICYWSVHLVWRFGKNPDNICIPFLTATGDLLGVSFLYLCFHLVFFTGNTSLKPLELPSLNSTLTAIENQL